MVYVVCSQQNICCELPPQCNAHSTCIDLIWIFFPHYGACHTVTQQLHQYSFPSYPQSQQLRGWVTLSSCDGRESSIIYVFSDSLQWNYCFLGCRKCKEEDELQSLKQITLVLLIMRWKRRCIHILYIEQYLQRRIHGHLTTTVESTIQYTSSCHDLVLKPQSNHLDG